MLTCDQKYVKGKPVKPYNSVIGEFFRACLSDYPPINLAPLTRTV